MVVLLITKLRKVYCWVCEWKKLKSVNIRQSYMQERDCLVHFIHLLAVWWPGAQSAWDNSHALACNFAKYSPILNFFFTHTLSNKPFLIWLLTTPPRLKYVATLRCNLSLMACFTDINVSQHSVATYARCDGIFSIHLTAIFQWKCCKSVKIWENCGLESMAPLFWLTLYIVTTRCDANDS